MKFVDEYRDPGLIKKLSEQIFLEYKDELTFMEVCGSHTMAVRKFGIQSLLPPGIRLISGPGCPVCVTSGEYINHLCALASMPGVTLATYGDLMKVPGGNTTLEKERAAFADIRYVQSSTEALVLAKNNPEREVIFAAIGFETTAPATAYAIKKASERGLKNFSVLCAHKTMPQAMEALIEQGTAIDGYLAPGHVTAVAGANIYATLAARFHTPIVVSGFEPVDILQSVLMLMRQAIQRKAQVEIQYRRLVTYAGNRQAKQVIEEVFAPCNAWWRGLGIIIGSGLAIRSGFLRYDAAQRFNVTPKPYHEPPGCICGEVLRGVSQPVQCGLFGIDCTPDNPVGACMVSEEGTCNNYFRFKL